MRALRKPDTGPRKQIYGVCKTLITKLTDYFFMLIYLGTVLFGNKPLFTQQKDNSPLVKCFGPIYFDFDEYLCYSGRKSEFFEKC